MSDVVEEEKFGAEAAGALASEVLAGMERRLRHSAAVAARAGELSGTVPKEDREVLVAAAWLHDIGYADALSDTGFHPLDGARHLERLGWPERVCALVAHHSGARLVADVLGVDAALDAYPREEGPVADALTYADQTVDSEGRPVTLVERLADMLERHGPESPNARAHPVREGHLVEVGERVKQRLRSLP